jgi:hypothetical protein
MTKTKLESRSKRSFQRQPESHLAEGESDNRNAALLKPSDPAAIAQMQQLQGNVRTSQFIQGANANSLQRDRQTIEMPEERVYGRVAQIGSGRTPSQETDSAIEDIVTGLQLYQSSFSAAIANWETVMNFASNQEAESHELSAAFGATRKFALSKAIEKLSKAVPVVGPAIDPIVQIATSINDEIERADNARGQVKIRDFIIGHRNRLSESMIRRVTEIRGQRIPLANAYRLTAASEDDGQTMSNESGTVVGPGAEFLHQLRSCVSAFTEELARVSPEIIQQMLSEEFARAGSLFVRGDYARSENGTLYLDCTVYRDVNAWQIQSVEDHWTLRTNAPQPDRLADSLRISLVGQEGKKPYQSSLKKVVKCTIENESDWALNSYDVGSYAFEDINDVRINNVEALLHRNDPNEFHVAWHEQGLKQRVMQVSGLIGSGS